jgi:threonine synthase
MDIQVASNFERYLYYRLGHDSSAVCDLMERFAAGEAINVGQAGGVVDSLIAAESGSSEDNLQAIRECYEAHGYLLDPHSALGWMAGRRHLDPEIPMVCLATAHPAKFGDAIQQALGRNIANHQLLDGLENSPTRCDRISASVDELKQYISNKIKL